MGDFLSKHLIIGAGFSGLGCGAAFREKGIPFDMVEAAPDLGGNWRHGVYETVHIISSRKTTEYSDFPMPSDWPDFPSAAQMLRYLNSYAEHHQLRPRISFSTSVERVSDAGGGRWRVELSNGETRVYGGVVVASGHHWDKRFPSYPGQFSGEIIHSKDYKRPEQLRDKRVLVIGGGNSACDIAVEAGRVGKSSLLSLRRGYWFLPKTMLGMPTVEIMRPWMPVWAQRLMLRALLRIVVGKYEDYGLPHPDHRMFTRHPTLNSELLYSLRHGRVTPKPDIARYQGREVLFTDGSRAEVDLIVAATGYHMSVPFLAPGLLAYQNGVPQVISSCFPTRHRNLYFFGFGQPRYGAGPLIREGAKSLAVAVEVQRSLKHPVGTLLAAMGQRPPKTVLQDPFQVIRQARRGRKLLPRLARLEPVLVRDSTP
jgi:hypothetical protein